jgi:ribosomal protein L24
VKTLTKEKKEKDNVLKILESINLKNVSLLQSEGFRRKTSEVEREKLMEDNKEYRRTLHHFQGWLERAHE